MLESFSDARLLHHYHAVAGDVLFMLSADGQRFLTLNPAVERLLGYGERDFLKHPELWFSLIVAADRQRVRDFRASGAPAGSMTYRIRDRSGHGVLVEETLWRSGANHPVCGRVVDISLREQALAHERQQLQAYRMMLMRSRDPMAMLEVRGTSLYLHEANPAWHLYHDAAMAHAGQTLERVYHSHVMHCLEGAGTLQCDVSLSLPRGDCRLSVQLVSLGRTQQGDSPRVAVMVRDISATHHRLEQAVNQRQRLMTQLNDTPGVRYCARGPWPLEELQSISSGVEMLAGLSRDLLLASPRIWQSRICEDDLAECQARFQEAVDSRSASVSLRYSFRHVDGRQCYLQDDMHLYYAAGGAVREVLGQLSDISESEAHRRQLEYLIQQMPGMVFQCRLSREEEFTYTYLSPVAHQLLGEEVDATLEDASRFLSHLNDQERQRLLESARASAETQSPWEPDIYYEHPDGETRRLACVALPQPMDPIDGSVTWNGYCDDITARHHIERALRQSEERYRFILDSVSDMVSIEGSDGICQYISPSVERLCGFGVNDIEGSEIKLLIHPDDRDRVARKVHRSACLGEVFRVDFRILHKQGHTLWFESISTPSMDPKTGRYLRILSVSRNINERKLIEQRREHEAMTDAMTGAMTRSCFLSMLDTLLVSASRDQIALVLFDVDHFKRVNDSFGHAAGDQLLSGLGGICQQQLRRNDYFGRLGGEEFGILLADAGVATAVGMAERLRQKIAGMTFAFMQQELLCTVSLGVATPLPGESRDDFLHRADMALYSAKRSGRNRVVVASSSVSEDNREEGM